MSDNLKIICDWILTTQDSAEPDVISFETSKFSSCF